MAGPWDRGPRPPRDRMPRPPRGPRTGSPPAYAADSSRARGVADAAPSDARAPADAGAAHHAARREELRLYGLNAVEAVFRRRPQAIRKLWLAQARIPALKPLLAWCVAQRVGYRVVETGDLDRLAASTHHEGVVADVLRPAPLPLEDWLGGLHADAPALAIWLDGVGNPHNFGAILRSAAHFGAAVMLPQGSPLALSGAAARVAEGGAEAVPLVQLPHGDAARAHLRDAGFTLAATVVRDGNDLFATRLPERLAYVMGAEGEGMDAGLAAACDLRLSIPGSGGVESLNVAAATAVFMAQWAAGRSGGL